MTYIYKYPLIATGRQNIKMPKGAEIIACQVQHDTVCLWAVVSPDNDEENREIEVFGTGHPMAEARRKYLGTVQLSNGALIFHVFERNPR